MDESKMRASSFAAAGQGIGYKDPLKRISAEIKNSGRNDL